MGAHQYSGGGALRELGTHIMALNDIEITAALDARHAAAAAAFSNRDIAAYRDIFSAQLRYEPNGGSVIDRSRLMDDVQAQFRKMGRAGSNFVREDLTVEGDHVCETLIQKAWFEASAFVLVRRRWHLERRGRYTWMVEDGRWRILHVRVLDEHIRSTWTIGF